jgi:hypothetical protein
MIYFHLHFSPSHLLWSIADFIIIPLGIPDFFKDWHQWQPIFQHIFHSIFICTFIKLEFFTDLSFHSLIWLSKLDSWFCIYSFYSWVPFYISKGLMGEVIFGKPFSTWDKNNNTPLFFLYQKIWITKNRSFNQNLIQLYVVYL